MDVFQGLHTENLALLKAQSQTDSLMAKAAISRQHINHATLGQGVYQAHQPTEGQRHPRKALTEDPAASAA